MPLKGWEGFLIFTRKTFNVILVPLDSSYNSQDKVKPNDRTTSTFYKIICFGKQFVRLPLSNSSDHYSVERNQRL